MLEKILFESKITFSDVGYIFKRYFKEFLIISILATFSAFFIQYYFYNYIEVQTHIYIARKVKKEKSYPDSPFILTPGDIVDMINSPEFILKIRKKISTQENFTIYNDTIKAKYDLNHNITINTIAPNAKLASEIAFEAIRLIILEQNDWAKKKKFLIDPDHKTKILDELKIYPHYSNKKKLAINTLIVLVSLMLTFFYFYYKNPKKNT